MEEIIKEIIDMSCEHLVAVPNDCKKNLAKALADMNREFTMWFKRMDEITFATNYSPMLHWHKETDNSINISEYHLDDIFKYWHSEIWSKK